MTRYTWLFPLSCDTCVRLFACINNIVTNLCVPIAVNYGADRMTPEVLLFDQPNGNQAWLQG
jgi:hypothetical protein